MAMLIAGLLLFLGVHSVRIFAADWRAARIAGMGEKRWKGLYSLVSLAGFDDLDIASEVVPALTTLRVPRYEIGRRAGEMICERLAGRVISPRIVDTGYSFMPRGTA